MRCPNCGSINTKRKGKSSGAPAGPSGSLKPLQRFVCRGCGKSFTTSRKTAASRASFSDAVALEAVRLYVQGLSSYRILAELLEPRLGRSISRFTLNRRVQELGALAKTSLEASIELAPTWGGFLGIDGKAIWIAGEEHALLLGVDHPTQDIVNALLLPSESAEGHIRLVTEVARDAGYPLQGITADLHPWVSRAYYDYFGKVPFQACRVHFDRKLDQSIPKAKRTPMAPLYAELKDRIRAALYAPTEEEARSIFQSLLSERSKFGAAGYAPIRSLQRNFELLMTHHRTPGLPPDNNVIENVIKQLSKKLRLMEGFQTVESAQGFIRLLVGCYRFKRFTDSGTVENGKAPLEIAGVDLAGRDWLSFLLDR